MRIGKRKTREREGIRGRVCTVSESAYRFPFRPKMDNHLTFGGELLMIFFFSTDARVHALRAPILLHTRQPDRLLDETPARKLGIIRELNHLLGVVERPQLEVLDLHRVSNGFSLRTHVAYR